jgi:flagellar biosynthesis/type III secretory pathway chaperone
MSTETVTVLRLLTQEREALRALSDLARRQEVALVSGELPLIQELAAQKSALLQREARISFHLASQVRTARSMPALLAGLPTDQRTQGEALVTELEQLCGDLKRVATRLTALADAGLNRVSFIYQALARAAEGPAPYQSRVRRPTGPATAVLSRRV